MAVVPFRYLVAAIKVMSEIPDKFLEGIPGEERPGIRDAWNRSLLLQVALWSRAYMAPEDW